MDSITTQPSQAQHCIAGTAVLGVHLPGALSCRLCLCSDQPCESKCQIRPPSQVLRFQMAMSTLSAAYRNAVWSDGALASCPPEGIHLATQSSSPVELLQAQPAGMRHSYHSTAAFQAAAAARHHPPLVGAMVLRA
jgi:hypothetical protein